MPACELPTPSAISATGSSSSGKKRAHSDKRGRGIKKARHEKQASLEHSDQESIKDNEERTHLTSIVAILRDHYSRKKITFISLLPLLSQNSIVIQGNASGAFVECSHNQIIYSTIFFALIFPRTLIIICDCRVKIRNFIYNEYGTSSWELFLNLAQQQIMWLADRSVELGQPIELGKESVVL